VSNQTQNAAGAAVLDGVASDSLVTIFMCTNSARSGVAPSCNALRRPAQAAPKWPFAAHEIVVPCTGKLQPEHLLKAFEAGADIVCVIACDEGNCHYMEGSRRVQRRAKFVRDMLDELGVGGQRLLTFSLRGSGKEDMAMGCGAAVSAAANGNEEETAARLKAIAEEIAGKLKALGASPLRQAGS
jgi:F420-non-reducing hydrogenase iron-sulfur subunit